MENIDKQKFKQEFLETLDNIKPGLRELLVERNNYLDKIAEEEARIAELEEVLSEDNKKEKDAIGFIMIFQEMTLLNIEDRLRNVLSSIHKACSMLDIDEEKILLDKLGIKLYPVAFSLNNFCFKLDGYVVIDEPNIEKSNERGR